MDGRSVKSRRDLTSRTRNHLTVSAWRRDPRFHVHGPPRPCEARHLALVAAAVKGGSVGEHGGGSDDVRGGSGATGGAFSFLLDGEIEAQQPTDPDKDLYNKGVATVILHALLNAAHAHSPRSPMCP